jgi:hypothetical protein
MMKVGMKVDPFSYLREHHGLLVLINSFNRFYNCLDTSVGLDACVWGCGVRQTFLVGCSNRTTLSGKGSVGTSHACPGVERLTVTRHVYIS